MLVPQSREMMRQKKRPPAFSTKGKGGLAILAPKLVGPPRNKLAAEGVGGLLPRVTCLGIKTLLSTLPAEVSGMKTEGGE